MNGQQYDETFFQSEVARLETLLARDPSPDVKASYETQLAAAKKYLAKFAETKTT